MRFLVSVVFVLAVVIVGLGLYLGPDDLSRCDPTPGDSAPCQAVDAIVAISGGDTTARATEAIELYKRGWAPLLIFSGAAQDKTGPSNAQVMRHVALEAGVPEQAIILENEGETTKQNAEKTQSIFQQRGVSRAILVTSAYHQRRASLEFNKETGMQVINHPVARDKQWSAWWWATPGGWWLALTEFSKVLVFYAGGTR